MNTKIASHVDIFSPKWVDTLFLKKSVGFVRGKPQNQVAAIFLTAFSCPFKFFKAKKSLFAQCVRHCVKLKESRRALFKSKFSHLFFYDLPRDLLYGAALLCCCWPFLEEPTTLWPRHGILLRQKKYVVPLLWVGRVSRNWRAKSSPMETLHEGNLKTR